VDLSRWLYYSLIDNRSSKNWLLKTRVKTATTVGGGGGGRGEVLRICIRFKLKRALLFWVLPNCFLNYLLYFAFTRLPVILSSVKSVPGLFYPKLYCSFYKAQMWDWTLRHNRMINLFDLSYYCLCYCHLHDSKTSSRLKEREKSLISWGKTSLSFNVTLQISVLLISSDLPRNCTTSSETSLPSFRFVQYHCTMGLSKKK